MNEQPADSFSAIAAFDAAVDDLIRAGKNSPDEIIAEGKRHNLSRFESLERMWQRLELNELELTPERHFVLAKKTLRR